MEHSVFSRLQKELKNLKHKKETANKAYLDALTYVKPFEEIKKLHLELKAIEAELTTAQTMIQLNLVVLN